MAKDRGRKTRAGIYRIIAHYGFMEEPNIDTIFALSHDKGLKTGNERRKFLPRPPETGISSKPKMSRWRSSLYIFLSQNSLDASSLFWYSSRQVIEVGIQLDF